MKLEKMKPKDFRNKNGLPNSMTKTWNIGFIDESSHIGTSIGREIGGGGCS